MLSLLGNPKLGGATIPESIGENGAFLGHFF
jgi:hypothetical protein